MYREDVIRDRSRFIKEYGEYFEQSVKVDPVTLEIIDEDEPYLMMSQDEKIHHR